MGGPGDSWNLVPITGRVNAQMRDGHERFLRPVVQDGRWFWYRARVNYYNDSDDASIGHLSDFPRQIIVAYCEMKRVGDRWVNVPPLMRQVYTNRKPRAPEFRPGRLAS
jgi:hypothetical protein